MNSKGKSTGINIQQAARLLSKGNNDINNNSVTVKQAEVNMAEPEKNVIKKNIIKIVYGEGCEICGVEKVISAEPTEIVLKAAGNTLVIKGSDFNVEKLVLETNELKISGKIQSASYQSVHAKQSLVKRIFK